MKIKYKELLLFICLLLTNKVVFSKPAPWVGTDFEDHPCKGGAQGFGPYDYTNISHKLDKIGGGEETALGIVERAHFPPNTEYLIKPVAGSFAGDLDYTLRAWPNHHKALLTLSRFQIMMNKKAIRPEKLMSPVECYFQRAIHFNPKDYGSQLLYANYLGKIGKPELAKEWYEKALNIFPDSARIAYSYSLFLINQKQYGLALQFAKKAYQNKNSPPGLKNKLKKIGIWKD